MSDKKYSVFISSTFEDLKEERSAVLRAILQHGHFPLGMEMWGAADEQQWQIIQRQIDVADYYVVIVAHRYGSLSDSGVSWTEREYDYAVEKCVPVLGFVQKGGTWPTEFVDKDQSAEWLNRFRAKIQSKPVSFWNSADQLRTEVILALGRQTQSTPRVGWIRGSEALTSDTLNELARLSLENSTLRVELDALRVRDELPDCRIELTRASVSALFTSDVEPEIRVDVYVEFCGMVRHGKTVGFVDHGCGLTLRFPGGEVLAISATLNKRHPVVFDGPTSAVLIGYGARSSRTTVEQARGKEIEVELRLRPIGYDHEYASKVGAAFEATQHDMLGQQTSEWLFESAFSGSGPD